MTTTASWLIEARVLFITASRSFDQGGFQQLTEHINHLLTATGSDEPVHIIHDLRAVEQPKRALAYMNAVYPRLFPVGLQALVVSDRYWPIEKRWLRRKLKTYQLQTITPSLDEAFKSLQQADPALPNLRTAFRARIREFVRQSPQSS